MPYLFLTPICMQDIFRLLTIENLFKGPPELVMGHSRVYSGLDSIISCGHAAKSSSSLQSFPPSEALNNSLALLHNKSQMRSASILCQRVKGNKSFKKKVSSSSSVFLAWVCN